MTYIHVHSSCTDNTKVKELDYNLIQYMMFKYLLGIYLFICNF